MAEHEIEIMDLSTKPHLKAVQMEKAYDDKDLIMRYYTIRIVHSPRMILSSLMTRGCSACASAVCIPLSGMFGA